MFSLLESGAKVAALVAPSFPAEFVDIAPGTLVAMIRSLGFDSVHEMSLGADLVAQAYNRLLEENPDKRYITTPCPAVVSYVRKYHPRLMPNLAPLVSPMVAMARVLRHEHGRGPQDGLHRSLRGQEAGLGRLHPPRDRSGAHLRRAAQRVREARHQARGLPLDDHFDPPYGGVGMVFPISGGLLQTAGLNEDLLTGEVIVAEGRDEFVDTISEFDLSHAGIRLLDVLACQGCYAGAGMTSDITMLQRRARSERLRQGPPGLTSARRSWPRSRRTQREVSRHRPIARARGRRADPGRLRDRPRSWKRSSTAWASSRPEDLLNCGACGYEGCLEHARAVYAGLADSEMCLPHTIEQLRVAYDELEESHRSLEDAKEALERSGKLASMGQLAAGIAHEVNNPLGTLLLHANLLLEECEDESQTKEDLETIVDQANRCKRIISGLLNFARQSRVLRQPTDVAELVDKVVRIDPVRGQRVGADSQRRCPTPWPRSTPTKWSRCSPTCSRTPSMPCPRAARSPSTSATTLRR